MTYEAIYDEFCEKFPEAEVADYRPALTIHIPHLSKSIPNAIIVWLKDGSEVIYKAEDKPKHEQKMDKGSMLEYIGKTIASYYAMLAYPDNTRKTRESLLAKIEALLEILCEFHIDYQVIGDCKGMTIDKTSYVYEIKRDEGLWSYCISEQKIVKCVE